MRKATVDFVMSVHLSARNNSAPTGRIFMKFDIWVFFANLWRKFKFHQNLTRITGTLLEDQYTVFIISHSFLLRMRNVSHKMVERERERKNTHFRFSNFFPENRTVYEIMLEHIRTGPSHGQYNTCALYATKTQSEYVTHCFPTATMVARTRLNITLFVHCLSCIPTRSTLIMNCCIAIHFLKQKIYTQPDIYIALSSIIFLEFPWRNVIFFC